MPDHKFSFQPRFTHTPPYAISAHPAIQMGNLRQLVAGGFANKTAKDTPPPVTSGTAAAPATRGDGAPAPTASGGSSGSSPHGRTAREGGDSGGGLERTGTSGGDGGVPAPATGSEAAFSDKTNPSQEQQQQQQQRGPQTAQVL